MPMMNAFRTAGFNGEAFMPGITHHVFLIGIRGEPQTPVLHRGHPLHPMQVVLAGPGDALPFSGREPAVGPLPALPAPHHLRRAGPAAASLAPREVTGGILRDAAGRLYEMNGDHVRPMHQLYTGPRGEMIELTPMPGGADGREAWAQSTAAGPADDAGDLVDAEHESDAAPVIEASRPRSFRDLVRRLAPDPGMWRLVRYADFIDAITPQLADARRLQPGHQLACFVQIYELAVMLPFATLEAAAGAELGAAGKLLPLSYDLCRRFALSLPRPALALAQARQPHAPGIVPAGARFLTLRVALDPTADVTPAPAAAVPTSTPASEPASPPAPTQPVANAVTTPTTKSIIPEAYQKPWDLKLGRDEALYDMTLATSRNAWQRMLDRWSNRIAAADMKKWHALLSGKSIDEQLWEIRPPKGGLADARIRQWAEQTLRLGDYDVDRMLVEWEIHWRRKGL